MEIGAWVILPDSGDIDGHARQVRWMELAFAQHSGCLELAVFQ
jgi:hypothetical protein